MHLNDQKKSDKKFIIEDLDATHLLIRGDARDEITKRVDEWMDLVSTNSSETFLVVYSSVVIRLHIISSYASIHYQNVFSSVERVGESLDTS
jgi:hypothetical protein